MPLVPGLRLLSIRNKSLAIYGRVDLCSPARNEKRDYSQCYLHSIPRSLIIRLSQYLLWAEINANTFTLHKWSDNPHMWPRVARSSRGHEINFLSANPKEDVGAEFMVRLLARGRKSIKVSCRMSVY